MILTIIWTAWAVINLIVFFLYGADKRRSQKGAWRIPERTLLTGTWLLGGVGAFTAMRVFRHKTKHLAFRLSAPAGAVLSILVMAAATAKLTGII
ncbi:MAG: DUF1294 domain-containing protein [Clostridia bacterium]|nr:DUF1294 domain-containing protein [Clostridia bacterium]